ncbi:hypothetical protein [Klebsiella phage vB_KpnP_ZX1]|nr:hypothetical protein [Klebsiella phage vB_KpnP_ZX1]
MALIQSPWATGMLLPARPQTAFSTHSQLYIVDVPAAGFASGDILELAILPPYARIVDAKLVVAGSLGAATVDVGLMSGLTGELTNEDGSARTVGTELFAAAALTAEVTQLAKSAALLVDPTQKDRSIGVKFSAAVTAGAGKKIGLLLSIAQYQQ